MPYANIRDVQINYEVLGESGPWVALTEGGRSGVEDVRNLASIVAAAGYRVLIHDRRNCGASDVSIDGEGSEPEVTAYDLYELLRHLGATPAYVGGASAGCRLSLLLAVRHPDAVSGLLLWRVSGGTFAANYLASSYYDEFIEAVAFGGMPAVCQTSWFSERIASRPENRERLLSMDAQRFADVMTRWRAWFVDGAGLPVLGATEAQLRAIEVPSLIIAGYDDIHPTAVAENLHRLWPHGELHYLLPYGYRLKDESKSVVRETDGDIAAAFVEFMRRVRRE